MSLPFKNAKSRLVDAWEHDYVTELMEQVEGNVSLAARRAGINRVHLYRLLRKHGWTESNPQDLARLFWVYWKLSDDLSLFERHHQLVDDYLVKHTGFYQKENGLVWLDEKDVMDPQFKKQGYGFYDCVQSTGYNLFASLLLWDAYMGMGEITLKPELRAHWLHEFNAKEEDLPYQLVGGTGNYNMILQAPEEDILKLGAGISAQLSDLLEVRIDLDTAHQRKVDHYAIVTDCVAGHVVRPATDGDRQISRRCQLDGSLHIAGAPAPGNEGGSAVNDRIPDRPRLVKPRVFGADNLAGKPS